MDLSGKLDTVVRSDPGRVRGRNEDAVYASASLGVAILADGMGGYNAGNVASGMAVAMLSEHFSELLQQRSLEELESHPVQTIDSAVCQANEAILNAAQRQPQYSGMGTTLVLGWFIDNRVYLAHLGDSRCYRWRPGCWPRCRRPPNRGSSGSRATVSTCGRSPHPSRKSSAR